MLWVLGVLSLEWSSNSNLKRKNFSFSSQLPFWGLHILSKTLVYTACPTSRTATVCAMSATLRVKLQVWGYGRGPLHWCHTLLLGSISHSNQIHWKTNCQYHHSDLHCDITLYESTAISLQLRSILALCEIGPVSPMFCHFGNQNACKDTVHV